MIVIVLPQLLAIGAFFYSFIRKAYAIDAENPYSPGGIASAKDMFHRFADEDGLLRLHGFSQVLRLMWKKAPDLCHDFVSKILHSWSSGSLELSLDSFLRKYTGYSQQLPWFFEQYQQYQLFQDNVFCWGEDQQRKNACCSLSKEHPDNAICFSKDFTRARCCRTGYSKQVPWFFEQYQQYKNYTTATYEEPQVNLSSMEELFENVSHASLEGRFCNTEMRAICLLGTADEHSYEKMAVVMVGEKKSFFPLTTLRHVVAPAANEGFAIDLFIVLAWTSGEDNALSTPFANVSTKSFKKYISRHARHYGINHLHLHLWKVLPAQITSVHSFSDRLKFAASILSHVDRSEMARYKSVLLSAANAVWMDNLDWLAFNDADTFFLSAGRMCEDQRASDELDHNVVVMGGHMAHRLFSSAISGGVELSRVLHEPHILGARVEVLPRMGFFPYLLARHVLTSDKTVRVCLDALLGSSLRHPTGACLHPDSVQHPLCKDT